MDRQETRKLEDLTPYDRNPRQNDGRAVDEVLESLKRHGQVKPIVVSAKGHPFEQEIICCGHTTLKAMQKFGAKECAVIVHQFKDESEFVDYNVRDNQSATFSMWDNGKLVELSQDFDLDLQGMGFDMASITGEDDKEITEDEVPEPPHEPITKPGDLWLLGDHRLLCGDSTNAEDVKLLMAGAKAGMMVTDPPYGVDYDGGQANAKKREKLSGDDTTEVFNAGLSAALNAVPSGAWYIWHADRYAEPVYAAIRKCGFDVRALIIWNKLKAHYGAPSAHYCQKHEPCLYAVRDSAGFCGPSNEVTVWDIEQPHRNEHHPTQKPIICMARAIRNHKAESVYDPFLGSGTTLIAAEQLGRKCYGMEISPAYVSVILDRWAKLTGRDPVIESTGQSWSDMKANGRASDAS